MINYDLLDEIRNKNVIRQIIILYVFFKKFLRLDKEYVYINYDSVKYNFRKPRLFWSTAS